MTDIEKSVTPESEESSKNVFPSEVPQKILYISLNNNHTCFAVGTSHGFYIFSVDPLKDRFHRCLLFRIHFLFFFC